VKFDELSKYNEQNQTSSLNKLQ